VCDTVQLFSVEAAALGLAAAAEATEATAERDALAEKLAASEASIAEAWRNSI
jgi:hypothetical protein